MLIENLNLCAVPDTVLGAGEPMAAGVIPLGGWGSGTVEPVAAKESASCVRCGTG